MPIRSTATAQDITPDKDVPLVGYTGSLRNSTGIRDPLYASAIHLRGGSGGTIIVSLDLLSLAPSFVRTIRQRIVDATGTHQRNILIGTTRNHSGPVTSSDLCSVADESHTEPDPDYLEHVVDQSVHAASEAAVASLPSKIAIVNFDTPHTGAALVKDLRSGRILAIIIVHDRIPDLLGPENTRLSSDFLSATRAKLTKSLGNEPVITYLPAPSGYRRVYAHQDECGEEAARRAGEELASLILTKGKALSPNEFVDDISFSGKSEQVYDMPRLSLPDRSTAQAILDQATRAYSVLNNAEASAEQQETAKWEVVKATDTLSLIRANEIGMIEKVLADSEPAEIQLMQIGNRQLLGMPGTIHPNCAQQLASSIGNDVWIAEGINGDLQGSILTSTGDGYELQSALYAPQAGDILADYAQSLSSDS